MTDLMKSANKLTRNAHFFQSEENVPYVDMKLDGGRRVTWPIESDYFIKWISSEFYKESKTPLHKNGCEQIIACLSAKACYEGPTETVHIRTAKSGDDYVIDLNDGRGTVVVVNKDGWSVCGEPPVKFQSPTSSLPLPAPERGGDFSEFWQFVNIPHADRDLVTVWLADCLCPDTEFALLELVGEQGSAKSTTQEFIKCLIDPQRDMLRSHINTIDDLSIYGCNAWVLSLNNLSYIKPEMQDAFCTISTGGTFGKRMLYTDSDQKLITLNRPVVINGISSLVTAQDLLDRTIKVSLPRLAMKYDKGAIESPRFSWRPVG